MAPSWKLELARFSALVRIQDGAECGNFVKKMLLIDGVPLHKKAKMSVFQNFGVAVNKAMYLQESKLAIALTGGKIGKVYSFHPEQVTKISQR